MCMYGDKLTLTGYGKAMLLFSQTQWLHFGVTEEMKLEWKKGNTVLNKETQKTIKQYRPTGRQGILKIY